MIMDVPRTQAQFPQTKWSMVLRSQNRGETGQDALAELCRSYWFPLYAFARKSGRNPADAEDLVQGFLSKAVQDRLFIRANSDKGKLRTFLLTAFRRYSRDEYEKTVTQKRGGGNVVSFDAMEAESWYGESELADEAPEKTFDRHWAITVLENAVQRLARDWEGRGKGSDFQALRPFLTASGSSEDYESVGKQISMKPDTVKVTIHRLRAKFGVALREEIQDTQTEDDDVDSELRYLIQLL